MSLLDISDFASSFIVIAVIVYLNIMLLYMTKKLYIGKCSLVKNLLHILVMAILSPPAVFVYSTSIIVSAYSSTAFAIKAYSFLNTVLHLSYEEAICVLLLPVYTLIYIFLTWLYTLYCKDRNRIPAAFLYLIFSAINFSVINIGLYTDSDSALGYILIGILLLVIIILFHNTIALPFLNLKKEAYPTQSVFYILPLVCLIFEHSIFFGTSSGDHDEIGFNDYSIIILLAFLLIFFFRSMIDNLSRIRDVEETKGEIKTLSVEVMEALAHTIDAKDEYTRGHSIRVARYSKMIAEKMELPPEQCENIYYMGLLHDIGKIGVPNEIINKPSKLTTDEYEQIKTHPGTGYEILAEIKSRPDLATGARWHHERYDGMGYPDQKAGEEIPLEARIIAVADSYDAMTSNRSYRKYLSQEKVKNEIRSNIGSQFDKKVAECMLSIIDEDRDYILHE